MMDSNTVAVLIRKVKGAPDDYGNDTFTDQMVAYPGVFWPDSTSERTAGQDQVTWQATVCLPADAVVSAIDSVLPQATLDDDGVLVIDGDGMPVDPVYAVDGAATIWPATPWGYRPDFPVELRLKRVGG